MAYLKDFQFILEPCCFLECGAGEKCLSDPDRIYSRDLLLLMSAVSYTAETAEVRHLEDVCVHSAPLGRSLTPVSCRLFWSGLRAAVLL